MIRSLMAAAFVSLSLAVCGSARAESPDFILVNSTGYTINEVYVSRPKSNSWGNDVMGKDALNDGKQVKITFNTDACSWDVKVVYDDDDTAVWGNVNLCTVHKLTLFWDKKTETTRAVSE